MTWLQTQLFQHGKYSLLVNLLHLKRSRTLAPVAAVVNVHTRIHSYLFINSLEYFGDTLIRPTTSPTPSLVDPVRSLCFALPQQ
jgi:hypothetical protein